MNAALVIMGYLLGSIPCSYLCARWLSGVDARRVGSGNLGAMNVMRNVGFVPGASGGIGDALKAAVAVWLALWLGCGPWVAPLAGLAAVIGHNWSVWCGWAGGKGLASALGATLVLYAAAVPWIVIVAVVAAVLLKDAMMGVAVGIVLLPVLLWLTIGDGIAVWYGLLLAVVVIAKMHPDIHSFSQGKRRLL